MSEKRSVWTACRGVPVRLSFIVLVFTMSGCEKPRRVSTAQVFTKPRRSAQEAGEISPQPAIAFPNKQSQSARDLCGQEQVCDFFDHTKDGCPPELLIKASKVLGGHITHAWDGGLPSRATKRRYLLITVSGKEGIFLERDGDYVYVNSQAELIGINDIVKESRFTRQDFSDADKTDSLLSEIAGLHQGPRRCPGSSFMLKTTLGNDSAWLRGTEGDVAVLRELCKDPQFAFEENTWTVVFNVFKADGSVDRWKVVGEHDPKANRNEILNIEVVPLRPAGTFSWPYMG